jgi:transposase
MRAALDRPACQSPSSKGGEMASQRLSMRKAREILRRKYELGHSHRDVARSLGVGVGTIGAALKRARDRGLLCWEDVAVLSEADLEARLYDTDPRTARPAPDCLQIHTERQRRGVTLELLHIEYLEQHPHGYRYTQFCEHYRRWAKKRKVSMRQVHRAGEKAFVDYAGHKPKIVSPITGEVREVEVFVATLGASSFIYAEATETQRSADFIASHTRAVEYWGGVPKLFVPDQLRSGVRSPNRYEPLVQRTYDEWSRHYGTTILPARPRKPQDKSKVEVSVQLVERWILAPIRDEVFHTLTALNQRIRELLDALNDRVMRDYGQSRRERFLQIDRPALQPLVSERFEYAEWKWAKANIDYHIELEKHFYSLPHPLVQERVEVRFTPRIVEIFHKGQRVAVHKRNHQLGKFTTTPAHMPKAHRAHLEWSPSRLIHWGRSVGPRTADLVKAILDDRPHPEQGYRSCLGILRLAKQYGHARLEAACDRAGRVRARSYRHVESILKNGLDREPLAGEAPARNEVSRSHENIRGGDYYH